MSAYDGNRSTRNVSTYIPVYIECPYQSTNRLDNIDCLNQSTNRLGNTANITWVRPEYKLKVSLNI